MKLILIATILTLASCSSFDGVRCFSIDGKASSWCKRKLRAERVCNKNSGLDSYHYNYAKCKNGLEFKNIN